MSVSAPLALRMWQRNRDAFLVNWKANAGGMVLEPVVILVAVGFGLGSLIDLGAVEGGSYARFIAPGVIAGSVMFHAAGECLWGTYVRMVNYRTLEAILATPMGVNEVVLGEMAWGATKATLSATAVLATAAALGLVPAPTAALVVPAAFLAGLMFSALTLVYTALAPSINVLENFYTLFLTPMFFFSGAFYPLSAMPEAARPLLWILPLTPVVHLARELTLGSPGASAIGSLALVALFTAAAAPLSLRLMHRRLIR